mmetsp:Transcript_45459/g.50960  ORF Transcript_45459/g.50960 Transcript_45459/m.50960 type:complete len:299 (-) Transcript_45459:269-1165(-)
MQHFLDWFRSIFPYYYDGCKACNIKKSLMGRNFFGRMYPNETQVNEGKAKTIELYHCNKCNGVTKFPRYNAAKFICSNKRGRCGEYSLLLYRMLHILGHKVRYVADVYNDHVWVEVQCRRMVVTTNDDDKIIKTNVTVSVEDKRTTTTTTTTTMMKKKKNQQEQEQEYNKSQQQQWLHLDPCEAAVNQKLLYQEWGRNINCILAFYNPVPTSQEMFLSSTTNNNNKSDPTLGWDQQQHPQQEIVMEIPIIEDVTQSYSTKTKQWLQLLPSLEKRKQRNRQKVIDEIILLLKGTTFMND